MDINTFASGKYVPALCLGLLQDTMPSKDAAGPSTPTSLPLQNNLNFDSLSNS